VTAPDADRAAGTLPDDAARIDSSLRQSLAQGHYANAGTSEDIASPQSREEAVRVSNAGVQRVEILAGNVDYLTITAFFHPDEAGDAIAAAIHMIRHAGALILDMRDNGGGSPDTMALIASYCFDRAGIPLAEITPRSGEAQHYVTASGIVDRDGKPPVYVLTSAHTWSGGEGLAYILQEHHRAEIIGETTVGAALELERYIVSPSRSCCV